MKHLCLAICLILLASPAFALQVFTNQELLVNGTFAAEKNAWILNGFFTLPDPLADRGGDGLGVKLEPTNMFDNENFVSSIVQFVPMLPNLDSAEISFDYRFHGTAQPQIFGQFLAGLFTEPTPYAEPITTFINTQNPAEAPIEWSSLHYTLTTDDLTAIQNTVNQGKVLYFILFLWAQNVGMHVDNISFTANGSTNPMNEIGTIAYTKKVDNEIQELRLIEPDGTGDRAIWGSNEPLQEIRDIAWRPDGQEIGFTSTVDAARSHYTADIFAIQPDGANLRRITNYPSQRAFPPNAPTGSVIGEIENTTDRHIILHIYVHGAPLRQTVTIAPKDIEPFRVDNVIDFGPLVTQSVSLHNDLKRQFAPKLLDILPGETVDLGLIQFFDQEGRFEVFNLSWNATGTKIAHVLGGLTQKITAFPTEYVVGDSLMGSIIASNPKYAPVDERILYESGLNLHFYDPVNSPDQTEKLLDNAGEAFWFPDGTGFVYVKEPYAKGNLFSYNFASSQSSQWSYFTNQMMFSPSLSPSGQYIVFYTASPDFTKSRMWMMEIAKPGIVWPLAPNTNASLPDWCPVDAKTTTINDWMWH